MLQAASSQEAHIQELEGLGSKHCISCHRSPAFRLSWLQQKAHRHDQQSAATELAAVQTAHRRELEQLQMRLQETTVQANFRITEAEAETKVLLAPLNELAAQ